MRNVYVCESACTRTRDAYLSDAPSESRSWPSVCGAFGLYGHGRPSREISRQTSLIPQTVFAQWQHSSFQFPSSATLHVVVVGVGIELSVELSFGKKRSEESRRKTTSFFGKRGGGGGLEETGEWEI